MREHRQKRREGRKIRSQKIIESVCMGTPLTRLWIIECKSFSIVFFYNENEHFSPVSYSGLGRDNYEILVRWRRILQLTRTNMDTVRRIKINLTNINSWKVEKWLQISWKIEAKNRSVVNTFNGRLSSQFQYCWVSKNYVFFQE